MAVRRGYGGGAGMRRSAAGGDPFAPQIPQTGRMPAPPPMPISGSPQPQRQPFGGGQQPGQPQQPGEQPAPMPPPPQLGAGGPMSPFNIEAMLHPKMSLEPETADGLLQGQDGQPPNDQNSGPGQSMPMIMLKLMQQMGRI